MSAQRNFAREKTRFFFLVEAASSEGYIERFGIDNAISAFASGYVTIGAVHMVSPARVDLLRAFADDMIGKQAKAWPPAAAKLFTGRTFLLNAAALSGGITLGGLYTLLKVVGLNW